jgi:hypothetical protein
MLWLVSACGGGAIEGEPSLRFVQAMHAPTTETADVYLRTSGQLTWPSSPSAEGLAYGEVLALAPATSHGEGESGSGDGGDSTPAVDLVALRSGEDPNAVLTTALAFEVAALEEQTSRLLVAHRPNLAGTPPELLVSEVFRIGEGHVVAFGGCQWLDPPVTLRGDDGSLLVSGVSAHGFASEGSKAAVGRELRWVEAEDEGGRVLRFTPTAPVRPDDVSLVLLDDVVEEGCLLVASDWARGRSEVVSPNR